MGITQLVKLTQKNMQGIKTGLLVRNIFGNELHYVLDINSCVNYKSPKPVVSANH